MAASIKRFCTWGVVAAVLTICGCVASGTGFRRLDDVGRLPQDARIGLAEFRQCGASYLDRLNPDYYGQDRKALFLLTCTEYGHPKAFHDGIHQRLEQRLGKKIVRVNTDKPFMLKVVLRDAEKLKLDYVVAGDLLAMGDTADEAVVSAQLFVVRVADRKVVLQGRDRKTGPRGTLQNVIKAVADELYEKAFVD